jgi:hypothetical protein
VIGGATLRLVSFIGFSSALVGPARVRGNITRNQRERNVASPVVMTIQESVTIRESVNDSTVCDDYGL